MGLPRKCPTLRGHQRSSTWIHGYKSSGHVREVLIWKPGESAGGGHPPAPDTGGGPKRVVQECQIKSNHFDDVKPNLFTRIQPALSGAVLGQIGSDLDQWVGIGMEQVGMKSHKTCDRLYGQQRRARRQYVRQLLSFAR